MPLPNFLKPFAQQAASYLKKGLVKDVEFSGGTYQVLVIDKDSGEEIWSFIQLDNRGKIKDCFCSCKDEEQSACVHICAGFLRIYNNFASPLHQRFERSLWNHLCRIYASRMGDDPGVLKQAGKGHCRCYSVGGKTVFDVQAKTPGDIARLKELVLQRKRETEETSLKFSNLSQEELMLWREGRPSAQLKYELSFWNDFAKWLMLLQDSGEKYNIEFGFSSHKLPNEILIDFPQVSMKFYLSEANLPLIIPALSTVESPLKVHNDPQEEIQSITYDKKEGCLLINPRPLPSPAGKPQKTQKEKSGHRLDGWIYVEGDGFYARNKHHLLATPKISGQQLAQALNENFYVIQKLLEGTQLHESPVQANYSIAFDNGWNLHLTCYLFAPGDLNFADSRSFGNWVYLDDDGFYRLEAAKFDKVETVVPQNEVADFVSKYRTWLNTQEGFHTHLASVEAQLAYHLSPDNHLSFSRKIALKDGGAESKDFGPWVYVAGQGFYSKVSAHVGLPLRSGVVLNAEQIPLFIRVNRDELQLVPGFFSQTCPVLKSGLKIDLDPLDNIVITPAYELLPEYQGRRIRFFDDFVYVEDEGFHELPVDSRLPERYRHPVVLEKENVPLFLTYEIEAIRQYADSINPRLIRPASISLIVSNISQDEQSPNDYILKLKYHTGSGNVPATTFWNAIKHRQKFLFSEAGLIDLEDKRYNWIRWVGKDKVDRRSHTLQLSTLELIRLHALENLEIPKGHGEAAVKTRRMLEELSEFRIPEDPDLTGLASQLRPYQMIGLRWLWFLYKHGLSGLLCDDMGLGKTHQAMGLLAGIRQGHKAQGKPVPHFLIVCPTSVIYHWLEKLQSYLPGARVCAFHGIHRSMEDFHSRYDILLTSYGVWRIDAEQLSQVSFEAAIFDEIQIAKNQSSRIYGALQSVNARMRIGLTGTPIENHLRELKSLFDIVLPGYMPGETDYRELFIKPIEKEGSQESKETLGRLIKPFVLRRKKEDVLLDLPEKIEEVFHCDLLPAQEQLYNDVLKGTRDRLLKDLEDEANPIPYIHIFALLSSLKQICNHPAVYYKTPEKYKDFQSGKWDLFIELLGEARESQQKVVVFSQYLAMLDIIEEYLNELGVGFATIRGATLNRGEQLHRFNKDPGCEVFVASLQAAGLGVDLTAASVVIHYDRWWNAARENQATDRVHRIGQTRGVQVFKLVTKDTFEERIDQLIAQKGKLMEEVVGVDDHRFIKAFSRNELIQLLTEAHKG